MKAVKIGLIINPIAGMGGKTALKGTDGRETLRKALLLGAVPEAEKKTERALRMLLPIKEKVEFFTCSGAMGERLLKKMGFSYQIVYQSADQAALGNQEEGAGTGPEDTEAGAAAVKRAGAAFLMFAGGDGTARDVYRAVGDRLSVIGIPAGVKIQSAVFGLTPEKAGSLARNLADSQSRKAEELPGRTVLREVVDLDEEQYRQGSISARIYGMMRVPESRNSFQNMKQSGFTGEREALAGIGAYLAEHMEKDRMYAIGSGSTAKCVSRSLGIPFELLGVDLVKNGSLVKKDVTEQELWDMTEEGLQIIVSPIGGQGFLFGRGNHQFSSRILNRAGKEGIIIVSPLEKLLSVSDGCLKIDCDDRETGEKISGYYLVLSGYGRFTSFLCKMPNNT